MTTSGWRTPRNWNRRMRKTPTSDVTSATFTAPCTSAEPSFSPPNSRRIPAGNLSAERAGVAASSTTEGRMSGSEKLRTVSVRTPSRLTIRLGRNSVATSATCRTGTRAPVVGDTTYAAATSSIPLRSAPSSLSVMSRSRFPSQNVETGAPAKAPASWLAMSASERPRRVATSGRTWSPSASSSSRQSVCTYALPGVRSKIRAMLSP